MSQYGFVDPDWEERLWYGMTYGRQIVPTPGLPNAMPVIKMVTPLNYVAEGTKTSTAGADRIPVHFAAPIRHAYGLRATGYGLQTTGFDLFDPSSYGDLITDAGQLANAAADAVKNFPGVSQLSDALGDFANTDVGHVVLTAFASSTFAPLAAVVGPQLASISFAIPGVMKGDPFTQAWLNGTLSRIRDAAQILSGGQAGAAFDAAAAPLIAQVKTAVQPVTDFLVANGGMVQSALGAMIPTPNLDTVLNNTDVTKLAAGIGIRPDMAQQAMDLVSGKLSGKTFDPRTGQPSLPAGVAVMPTAQFTPAQIAQIAANRANVARMVSRREAARTAVKSLPANAITQAAAAFRKAPIVTLQDLQTQVASLNAQIAVQTAKSKIPGPTGAVAAALLLALHAQLTKAQSQIADLQRQAQAAALVAAANAGVPDAHASLATIQNAAAQGNPQAIADLAAVNTAAMTRAQWISHYNQLKQAVGPALPLPQQTAGISRFNVSGPGGGRMLFTAGAESVGFCTAGCGCSPR